MAACAPNRYQRTPSASSADARSASVAAAALGTVDLGKDVEQPQVRAKVFVSICSCGPPAYDRANLLVQSASDDFGARRVENDGHTLERGPITVPERAHVLRLPDHCKRIALDSDAGHDRNATPDRRSPRFGRQAGGSAGARAGVDVDESVG